MKKEFNLHEGHRERVRYRIKTEETDWIPAHEVMEYMLYHSISRQDVNDLAHRMLDHFGAINTMLKADPGDFCQIEGIGEKTMEFLTLMTKCTKAFNGLRRKKFQSLNNFADAYRLAEEMRSQFQPPCCVQISLGRNNHPIYLTRISNSLDWADSIHIAIADAMSNPTNSIILFLFTGGCSDPREYDLRCVSDYAHTLKINNCMLLDMLIIGDTITSLRRNRNIPDYVFSQYCCNIRKQYLLPAIHEPAEEAPVPPHLIILPEVET